MSPIKETQPRRVLMATRTIVHALYRCQGTGLPRLAEWVRRRVARQSGAGAREKNNWINDFCGNLCFYCDLSEHMGSQIFFRGSYSGGQLNVLRKLLKEDSVFVDAGANQGEFTVCAAGMVPEGQVFAFEPVTTVRERLEQNIQVNRFRNVKILPVGLSDESRDDVPIFGPDAVFADGTRHVGLPTLFGMDGRHTPFERIGLRRLDDLLREGQRVDVMKVDVEGAELSVLEGAERIIEREQPAIIFEANEETCHAAGYGLEGLFGWLREHGYRLERIDSRGRLAPIKENIPFSNVLASVDQGRNGHQKANSG